MRNGVGLYRDIVAQGYTGSRMTVERFLLGLRDLEKQGQLSATLAAPVELTPHRAVGLLLKRAEERTEEETRARLASRPASSRHCADATADAPVSPDGARTTQ